MTGFRSKTVIALKTTRCVLGSANQKVSATIGVDGGSQIAVLVVLQRALVVHSQRPHLLKPVQAAVIIDLMVVVHYYYLHYI